MPVYDYYYFLFLEGEQERGLTRVLFLSPQPQSGRRENGDESKKVGKSGPGPDS